MHKKKVLFFREPQVHTILLRRLSPHGYRVYPKVRLADAIGRDRGEQRLPDRAFEYLLKAHLDFLVVRDDTPILAIEFDGVDHLRNPETLKLDNLKNRLCRSADLPLLRVMSEEIREHDRLTLLDYMLIRYVAWQREFSDIVMDYGSVL